MMSMIITKLEHAKTEGKHAGTDVGRWGLDSKEQDTALDNRLMLLREYNPSAS